MRTPHCSGGRIIPAGAGKVNFAKNEKGDTWHYITMLSDPQTKKATQYINAKVVSDVDYKGKLTKFDFANLEDKAVKVGMDYWTK